MLALRRPGNRGGTARQVDPHIVVQQSLPPADGDGGTGPGSAGQCVPHTALEYAQPNMASIHDLHESHVGALRKTLMMLDTRPKPVERRGFHVGHLYYRMGISH